MYFFSPELTGSFESRIKSLLTYFMTVCMSITTDELATVSGC